MTWDADTLSGIAFILFLVFVAVTWYIKHKDDFDGWGW